MRRTTVVAAAAILACSSGNATVPEGARVLRAGTWGGVNAGLIVDDTIAHAHIGCTFGNFRVPVTTDTYGQFSVTGEYLLRAYPIAVGPTLPAQFVGTVKYGVVSLTVTVNDTVEHRTQTLGPVTVTLGKDPQLGPCPICRSAKEGLTRLQGLRAH